MRPFRTLLLVFAVAGMASAAWAQVGSYGSQELPRLSPASQPYRPILASAGQPAPSAPSPAQPPAPTTPPASSPSIVSQMLLEAGCGDAPSYQPRGCRSFASGTCDANGDVCFEPCWYVSGAGLVMTRDHGNRVWTTFETGVPANGLMHTENASADWEGGYEIRLGRRLAGGCWAVEGTYWAVNGFDGYAEAWAPGLGTLSTPLGVSGIEFDGQGGDLFFNDAAEHRLWRHDDINNVEINLVRSRLAEERGLADVRYLLGVRYFRFSDELTFGSLAFGGDGWGGSGLDEAYLYDRVTNHLVGFQFGLDARYHLGYGLRLFAAPTMAIGGNHIAHRFRAYRGDGLGASLSPLSGFTGDYPVSSSDNVFAFLGQIDAGLDWQLNPRWSAFIGYRLIAATGIGLADSQIPESVDNLPELANVDHNGHLIVHGGFAGLKVRF